MGEFIDMQAEIGISKHQGGLPATRQLLGLCHIEAAGEVLDVGCGIGVGPAHIARTHGCRVVGVDLSPRMIEWARRRVREEGVGERVELLVADALDLPFEADRFDVVVAESVLAFVGNKERAIRELVRVTRPGGHVGLNELVWLEELPADVLDLARDLGTTVMSAQDWRALWDGSGLEDRVVKIRRLDPIVEVRSRMRWVGLPGWCGPGAGPSASSSPSLRPGARTGRLPRVPDRRSTGGAGGCSPAGSSSGRSRRNPWPSAQRERTMPRLEPPRSAPARAGA